MLFINEETKINKEDIVILKEKTINIKKIFENIEKV